MDGTRQEGGTVMSDSSTAFQQMMSKALGGNGTWTPAVTAAPADSGVIQASPCYAAEIMVANSHAATTVYFQIFDLTAVPADATVPRLPSVPILPGETKILEVRLNCLVGLCWASSSTVPDKHITAITPLQVSALLVP